MFAPRIVSRTTREKLEATRIAGIITWQANTVVCMWWRFCIRPTTINFFWLISWLISRTMDSAQSRIACQCDGGLLGLHFRVRGFPNFSSVSVICMSLFKLSRSCSHMASSCFDAAFPVSTRRSRCKPKAYKAVPHCFALRTIPHTGLQSFPHTSFYICSALYHSLPS